MLLKKLGCAIAMPCLLMAAIADELTQTSSAILATSGGNSINLDNISGDLLIDSDVTLSGTLNNANLNFSNEITVTLADSGITVDGDTSFNDNSIITLVAATPSTGITANSIQASGILIANNLNLNAASSIDFNLSAAIEIASTGSLTLATDTVTFDEIVNGATLTTNIDLTNPTTGAALSSAVSGVLTIPDGSFNEVTLVLSNSSNEIIVQDVTITGAVLINSGTATLELNAPTITVDESRQGDLTNDISGLGGIFISAPTPPQQILLDGSVINTGTINGATQGIIIQSATLQGDIVNTGEISASMGNAIEVSDGIVEGIIDNRGTISSASNFAISVNNGSVAGVFNGEDGVINSGNGIAITAANQASSIGFVTNAGLINGSIDFGNGGGIFNALGGSSGSVIGATTLNIQLAPQATSNTVSSINGDLNFAGNINLAFQGISQSTGNASVAGVLNVAGAADITGSSLAVNVTGDVFIAGGDEIAFLNANSLTSDLTSASDNSAVLDFTLSQRGNSLFATAVRTPIENIVNNGISGAEANVQAVATSVSSAAQQLDDNTIASDSELANVVNSLSTLATPEQVAAAVKTLEPEAVDSTSAAAQIVDAMSSTVINERLASLRGTGFSGAIAGDSLAVAGFWTQYYDNRSKQDTVKDVDGFDADTFGLALGVDASLENGMNIGLAFSYADTDVRSAGVENNQLDVESFRLTAYGSYNAPGYFVDAQLGFARNQYDSVRNIFNGTTTGLRATSDHDGDQYTAQLRVGKPIVFDNGILVTVKGSAQYSYLVEDSYSEKNAGNAGLTVDTGKVDAFVLGAGVDVAYAITTANEITWVPELRLQVLYDFIGDEIEVDSNFVGVSAAAFTTQGSNVEQTAIKAGIGLRAYSQGNISVALNADYLYKKDYDSVSGSLTVRYGF